MHPLIHPPRHQIAPSLRRMLAVAVVAGVLGIMPARAEDWRYCLAVLNSEHKVYVSEPFPTAKSMERLQDEFAGALARAGIRHGAVQCPRGDEQSIAVMRRKAVRFNHDSGNAVVDFDRWNP